MRSEFRLSPCNLRKMNNCFILLIRYKLMIPAKQAVPEANRPQSSIRFVGFLLSSFQNVAYHSKLFLTVHGCIKVPKSGYGSRP